jgi:glycosyltransferase involved in cell wall biosynthesis
VQSITAIILTLNESLHLQRCIDSIAPLTKDIVVVDAGSTDDTLRIAGRNQVTLLPHAWPGNHAAQFNWALGQLSNSTQWIIRVDADEVLTSELIQQVRHALQSGDSSINGLSCYRYLVFQGRLLRHGGMARNRVLRIFRYGFGRSELRWMDEHITVEGQVCHLNAALIDENLNPLSWWIVKHNQYASRAAVDLLERELHLVLNPQSSALSIGQAQSYAIKEWCYRLLPLGLRGFVFYIYRLVFLFGFLDGASGRTFYFLQTYWYRNLIDAKVMEVRRYMMMHQVSPKVAIKEVLGITLDQ